MSAEVIQFVPRNARTRKPMLEKLAHEIIEQVTKPATDCGEEMQKAADAMRDEPA